MVVSPQPAGGNVLNLLDVVEQVAGKPRVSNGSIVAFDVLANHYGATLDTDGEPRAPEAMCRTHRRHNLKDRRTLKQQFTGEILLLNQRHRPL